ncbi:MAG TPA: ATP-binding protein [Roseiflexaceae bacterium]|nr:ATP-binding protein [Roseiflexaceae bacterium]
MRLLLTMIVVVFVAVGTVAALASRATASELQRYVDLDLQRNRHVIDALLEYHAQHRAGGDSASIARDMRDIVGERVLLTDEQGMVTGDSDGELVGNQLGCDTPVAAVIVTTGRSSCLMTQAMAFEGPALQTMPVEGTIALPPAAVTDNILFFGFTTSERFEFQREAVAYASGAQAEMPVPNITIMRARGPGFDPIQAGFISTVNRSLLLAAGAAGLVALLLTAALSRRILGPVEALTAAARKMEKGDLSQRVTVRSQDEIGELARAFNAMADGLARIEQLRRHMVTDVAHELRTPLTNIRGYLEALRDGVARPDAPLIDSLHEEALLLNRLVDDLQDLALVEAGQLRLARSPVALGPLVEAAVSALRPALADKDLTIAVDLADDLPCADADAARVGQVLRNLLNNAIIHTPRGGSITVQATTDHRPPTTDHRPTTNDQSQEPTRKTPCLTRSPAHPFTRSPSIVVRVSDSGPGIAPEHLPHIFERFYRADRARARATGGAGLGLTIVKQLVEAHGGQVWVASVPNQGSTFAFTLPVDKTSYN